MKQLKGKCKEQWKPIIGYEGRYEVSDLGNVKSLDRFVENGKAGYFRKGKALNLSKATNGYLFVRLSKKGEVKPHLVHRLVGIAFVGNPNNRRTINHKNGIKTDNNVNNLEWLSLQQNIMHGFDIGIIDRKSISVPIKSINPKTKEEIKYDSIREAERHGYKKSTISLCINGKQKTHKGLVWEKQ